MLADTLHFCDPRMQLKRLIHSDRDVLVENREILEGAITDHLGSDVGPDPGRCLRDPEVLGRDTIHGSGNDRLAPSLPPVDDRTDDHDEQDNEEHRDQRTVHASVDTASWIS